MTDLNSLSPGAIQSSLGTRLVDPAAHEPFATDFVQLAFGRNGQGRIVHVSGVARGASCDCTCPACGEALISRQGAKKAWHFAHASGKSCKAAMAAAAAGLLCQSLNDGAALTLPETVLTWGRKSEVLSEERTVAFDRAEVTRSPHGQFIVAAVLDGKSGPRTLLIRAALDASEATRERQDVSELLVDLKTPVLAQVQSGRGISEAWMADQILSTAPRSWAHNTALQSAIDARVASRLADAMDRAATCRSSDRAAETAAEIQVREFGLSAALETSSILGERFLGPTPKAWRAEIIMALLITPKLTFGSQLMLKDAGIDRRAILRALGASGIVKDGVLMRPLPSDDQMELVARVPDLRPPLGVVEDYLSQLWQIGFVAARPTARRRAAAAGPLDERLAPAGMPDWIPTDKVFSMIEKRRLESRR